MIGLFCFVLAVLPSPFRSRLRLEAENAALRHQLVVSRRRLQGRNRLTSHDRWFFIQLYRWCQFRFQYETDASRRFSGLGSSSVTPDLVSFETSASFFRFQLRLIDRSIDRTCRHAQLS